MNPRPQLPKTLFFHKIIDETLNQYYNIAVKALVSNLPRRKEAMLRPLGLTVAFMIFVCTAAASPPPAWLQYDDGTPYQPVYRENANDGWAVKFVPPLPGYIQRVRLYVGNPPRHTGWEGFNLEIWNWDAASMPPAPGKRVWGPKTFTYDHGGWVSYKGIDYWWKDTEPFVILAKQRQGYPKCDTIFCDPKRTEPNPNWSYFKTKWYPFELVNGDLMIRAYYGASLPGVEPTSLGRVKTLYR
jgi:hypothetical protein